MTWTTTNVGPASTDPEPERPVKSATGGTFSGMDTFTTEQSLNWREETLLKTLRIAVADGWQGWKTHVNDAVTVGQEAEGVLRDYRRGAKPIEPLIFDHEFAAAAGYDLVALVLSTDRMRYLKENV